MSTTNAPHKVTTYNAPKEGLSGSDARKKQLVWLQGMGWCKGKPLAEFAVDETMVWNTGGMSTVVELVRNKKGAVVGVVEAYTDSQGTARTHTRKRRGETLTVFAHAGAGR